LLEIGRLEKAQMGLLEVADLTKGYMGLRECQPLFPLVYAKHLPLRSHLAKEISKHPILHEW